jgi:hypothetical protein
MANDPANTSLRRQWRDFRRFLGRAFLVLSIFFLLGSGYLAFAHYWILTRWDMSYATVLNGEIRQFTSGSTSTSRSASSSRSYFVHCTVSYLADGEQRQSHFDSPASPNRIDAAVWAARLSRGQQVAIFYKPSDPGNIRLADNPAEATALGSLRLALYFLAPALLLTLTSRTTE